MPGPTRDNQGSAAIIGSKTEKDKEQREHFRWMCLQLSVTSFGNGLASSDWSTRIILDRATTMYDFLTTDNEGTTNA